MKQIIVLFFLVLFVSSFVMAQETPSLPTIIQGEVMINNKPAPAGTLVSAKINNEIIKEYTLTEPGNYALTISNEEGSINIYVNDVATNQTVNLESGKIIDADLNVKIKTGISKLFFIITPLLILLIVLIIVVKRKKH